jgi:hypothetical protein
MQFTPARCRRRLSNDGEAELLRRLAPHSPDRVQPPYEHLRCAHVAPPARQRARDGVAGSSRRREPSGATSTRHLGECKVCLVFFCSATGEAQTSRQTQPRMTTCLVALTRQPGPARHARHLQVLLSLLLSRVLRILHDPRDWRKQAELRHVHNPSPLCFLYADLSRRNNWIQATIDLGEVLFGHSFFMVPIRRFVMWTSVAREVA